MRSRLCSPLLLCGLPALLLLASCASDRGPEKESKTFPEAKLAPVKVEDSFQPMAAGADFQSPKGSLLRIRKSSLGKSFLLTMAMKSASSSPRIEVLLPKLIAFEMNGSEIALIEENYHSIHKEIPHGRLLQSFPVEKEDADSVVFRWAYGLSSIPNNRFYVDSDDPNAPAQQVAGQEISLPVVASYLRKAEVRDNRLELRQLSRVSSLEVNLSEDTKSVEGRSKGETVELDIAIAPYVPSKTFQPRLSTRLQGVGFFELAQTRKEKGNIDLLASRWDLSPAAGPITYAVSKTAPPETVEAIKEGILYWNAVSQAALGRDIVRVETGADPDSPPRPRRVLVYWVPFANAGSAYANFQPDPLTGEISSGIVYQTSVFYLSGKGAGRRLMSRGAENGNRMVPAGFRSASLCDLDPPASDLTSDEADERVAKKAALDYLRNVIAHEVGHTLGLRHNFAATLGSEISTMEEHRAAVRDYLNNESSGPVRTTSSVMDYETFRDRLFVGRMIHARQALPYDKAAIEWGYGEKHVRGEDIPLPPTTPYFCTDGEAYAEKTLGCALWDASPHPLAGYAWELSRGRALLGDLVIESIFDSIRAAEDVDSVSVRAALARSSPEGIVSSLLITAQNFPRLGSKGVKHIAVDRALRGSNWANSAEYEERTRAEIAKEFDGVGGLPGFLKSAYGLDDSFHAPRGWLLASVEEKMRKPGFGRGKDGGGRSYHVSGTELEEAKAAIRRLARATEDAYLRDLLLKVTRQGEVKKGEEAAKLESYRKQPEPEKAYEKTLGQESWQPGLQALAEQLATDSEGEVEGTVDGAPLKVPAPKFTLDQRVAAMRLFSPKVFGTTADTWMKDGHARLFAALAARLSPVMKLKDGDPEKAEPAGKASKELLDWAHGEVEVLKALKAAR